MFNVKRDSDKIDSNIELNEIKSEESDTYTDLQTRPTNTIPYSSDLLSGMEPNKMDAKTCKSFVYLTLPSNTGSTSIQVNSPLDINLFSTAAHHQLDVTSAPDNETLHRNFVQEEIMDTAKGFKCGVCNF